ncbi:hypothetical protein [Jatrophihabitans endophyticus]|uniref:hypothetical protein n=1 Tax=Jatrophihabitans endophyticus TaxID=1206085 RepID=UPI0019EE6C50|nr:hypothetical protein [Jatrophihabitans endophyticus]MBE7189192.1 hypothetical protein [Jatrophihabitans endophyticus]
MAVTPPDASRAGDLTDALVATDWWNDQMLHEAGIPVVDVPFVSIGGGIGSFVTVDYLRIAGVPTQNMRVLSNIDHPWQTYEYLTRVSQIPRPERIRSDSASRPDNIWGFPSYAIEEAWREKSLKSAVQVLLEPMWRDFYTPRAGMVFGHLEREARRIRYWDMLVKGQVRMIRRRQGGGYFTVLTPPPGASATKRVAFRSQFVHVAIGYPGLKYLPDLQDFRTRMQDFHHVVSAYEDHEHVYNQLRTRPGTVLIRGGGIVASRVLQRLMDDRAKYGLQTRIVHLFRTFVAGSHGKNAWNRRKGGNGFAYQGFNYPKSVWGGQLKSRMRRLEGQQRATAYDEMGGTNTPWRRSWQAQMDEGRRLGWYQVLQGTVAGMSFAPDGRIVSSVRTGTGNAPGQTLDVAADFVIDCTGLEADIAEHRVLADLLEHSGAGRNPKGRLDVERTFELRGTASAPGAMYASGSPTLGGYFPGVDTFLGLQVAAQEITDDLARRGFGRRIGPARSVSQWLKWARNVQI